MGVRVYELSKKYGVDNAVLIEKLHVLGYKAIKQPSNTIDKITAEFLINELHLVEVVPPPPAPAAPPPIAPTVPVVETPKPPAAPSTPTAPATPTSPPLPRSMAVPPLGIAKALMQTAIAPRPSAPARPTPPVTAAPSARHVGPNEPTALTKRAAPVPQKLVGPDAPTTPAAPAVERATEQPLSLARAHIPPDRIIKMRSPVLVRDLASRLKLKPFQVISELMQLGVFAKVTDAIDEEVAKRLCGKRGYFFELEKRVHERAEVHKTEQILKTPPRPEEKPEDLKPRPPVVTIMGHVDHGKTSLLDTIRKTDVAAGEAGGITQHIGAYTVMVASPHKEKAGQLEQITFLDTPGHEAFTKMRARGANVTDIAVLVVAADDGVMPQTIESINHAKAAKVPIIVAVNKMDVPGANPLKVKTQLQQHGLNPEEFGGDIICCEVSATKKLGIDKLLENIILQAELLELKANPKRKAIGIIIEAELRAGAGPTATVLIRAGTLKQGDPIICGAYWGKVRAMQDDKGQKIKQAGPAMPVQILGLNGVPEPGAELTVMASEKEARDLAEQRQQEKRAVPADSARKATREAIFAAFEAGEKKTLNIVLKGDVQGSLEAIAAALMDIKSDKITLEIIHAAIGSVSENDILLASASEGIIIGFGVKLASGASDLAKREGVEIRLYSIIYELIDAVKEAMAGQLEPISKEVIVGHAEVKQVFEVSKGTVAGCVVTDGRVTHGGRARVLRRKAVQCESFITTLRRFQDDIKEVRAGLDCGIRVEGYQDYQTGDLIEVYTVEKVAQKL